MEKETVGLYLSGHPLDEYRTRLRAAGVTPVLRILQSFEENDGFFHDGQNVRIAGMVEEIRRKTTRNGSMMAYVTLEDDTAAMELLTFSNVLERSGSLLTENAAVVAEGRISVRDEKAPQLVVNRFDPLESFTKQAPPPMAAAPRPLRRSRRSCRPRGCICACRRSSRRCSARSAPRSTCSPAMWRPSCILRIRASAAAHSAACAAICCRSCAPCSVRIPSC